MVRELENSLTNIIYIFYEDVMDIYALNFKKNETKNHYVGRCFVPNNSFRAKFSSNTGMA